MRLYLMNCALAMAATLVTLVSAPVEAAPPNATMPARVVASAEPLLLAYAAFPREASRALLNVGFYARSPVSSLSDFAPMRGSKLLRLTSSKTLDAGQMAQILMRGVEHTSSRAELVNHMPEFTHVREVLVAERTVKAGESFGFDYVPNHGVRVMVDDQPVGPFIGNDVLFELLVRPWVAPARELGVAAL